MRCSLSVRGRRRSCRLFRLTDDYSFYESEGAAVAADPTVGRTGALLTALLLDPEHELSVSDLADISETSVL